MKVLHKRGLLAVGAATALAVTGIVVLPAVNASRASGCRVAYTANSWPGGFTGNITITNLGDAVNGWTLGLTFPDAGQRVGQGWSATYSQSGTAVTARSLDYNGALATGASTGIGFNGTWTGANPSPTAFTLNGGRAPARRRPRRRRRHAADAPSPTSTPDVPTTSRRPPAAPPVAINGSCTSAGSTSATSTTRRSSCAA